MTHFDPRATILRPAALPLEVRRGLLLALALGPLGPALGGPVADTATVNLTVESFCEVEVDPQGIFRWGQGHLPNGEPNYAKDGAEPRFKGGKATDQWKVAPGGTRKYANSAVGRCWLKTRANCQAKVKAVQQDIELVYVTPWGERCEIKCECWIGWEIRPGEIWIADEREDLPPGEHTMWLCATAQRKGLCDEAGAYWGTATVTIMADP